jgi:hypothetical protein
MLQIYQRRRGGGEEKKRIDRLGEPVSAFRSRKKKSPCANGETRSFIFDSFHYAFGILGDDGSSAWHRLMEKQIKLITIEPRNEANKSVSSLSRENELMNKTETREKMKMICRAIEAK